MEGQGGDPNCRGADYHQQRSTSSQALAPETGFPDYSLAMNRCSGAATNFSAWGGNANGRGVYNNLGRDRPSSSSPRPTSTGLHAPPADADHRRSDSRAAYANVYHRPGYNSNPGAADFSDPYNSALLAPPADADQGASRGPVDGDSNPARPALHNVRDLNIAIQRARTPGELQALVNVFTSKHLQGGGSLIEVAEPSEWEIALKELVKRLLALDLAPEVYQKLFRGLHATGAGVSNPPDFSARSRANDLRIALRLAKTPGDLEGIVRSLVWNHYNGGVPLMELAEPGDGEAALKEFIERLEVHRLNESLQMIFKCLIESWRMDQINGPNLLQHFFTTIDCAHCSELVLPRFWEMLTSRVGYMGFIILCLENAGYTAGAALQESIVTHTIQLAKNESGSQLLQIFFKGGCNDPLRERITERIEKNLMALSMDQHGYLVVQACFAPNRPSMFLLQRGLRAFLRLPEEDLRELVQNHSSGYVLIWLLRLTQHTSIVRGVASPEALQLARRIMGLETAGHEMCSIAQLVIDEQEPWEARSRAARD